MLDHERAREIAAIPADQLAAGDLDWLNLHLAGCPECRAVIRLVDAPADDGAVAWERGPDPNSGPAPAWRRPRVRVGVAIAATLAVTLVGGLFAWTRPPAGDRTANVPASSAQPGSPSA